MTPYYVAPGQCTDLEPFPGWYVLGADGQPVEVLEKAGEAQ